MSQLAWRARDYRVKASPKPAGDQGIPWSVLGVVVVSLAVSSWCLFWCGHLAAPLSFAPLPTSPRAPSGPGARASPEGAGSRSSIWQVPAGRCLTRSRATWHVCRRSAQSHPRQRPFSRERPDGVWPCLDRSGWPERRDAGGGSTMIVTAGPGRKRGGKGSRDADIDILSGFGGASRASRKRPSQTLHFFFSHVAQIPQEWVGSPR